MPRLRTHLALAALIAAAAPFAADPAAAQNRYDAGSFTIELPRGIELALTNVAEYPASRSELFTGGDPQHGAVMVIHAANTGTPSDTAVHTPAGIQRLMRGDSARLHAALNAPRDTSQARRRQQLRALNDTSLVNRRALLRSTRDTWAGGSRHMSLGRETREIVNENRVTLRSPVTILLTTGPSLTGIADVSMTRRGQAKLWIVIYSAQSWKPEDQAMAERILDSFHITGAATSVSVTPGGP